ncbi:hypothetical protein [Runella limosa]|uniref:hypothetical protein n=1 Tax=Runella limosa TaxID=370978 RepID=UPI0004179F0C|nr:hypothetical protein [Runella limosa]
MITQTRFEEEVRAFLSFQQDQELPILGQRFLRPVLYFPERLLAIHLISLDKTNSLLPDTFVQLSDALAAEGIKVIHLWEDVWYSKKAVVQSRLRAAFGISQRIPARLTKVRRIDKPTLERFMDAHHLQVSTNAKFKYGLFLPKNYQRILKDDSPATPFLTQQMTIQGEALVAVASFSGGKNILRERETFRSFELIRFANHLDCTVVGGLDKLLKAFVTELQPDDIMTYADRDWSDGRSYERLGFERMGATPPHTFWVNPNTWERHYAERLLPNDIGLDWIKVYNSGNWKFLKKMI